MTRPNESRGFFAELGIGEEQDYFFVLSSFDSSMSLEEYAQGVRLPE